MGRYLYFSSSDGSDPEKNERSYAFATAGEDALVGTPTERTGETMTESLLLDRLRRDVLEAINVGTSSGRVVPRVIRRWP